MFNRIRKFIPALRVLLLLIIALAMTRPVMAQEGEPEQGYAYAIVNGAELPLAPGMVIATGELRSGGICSMPLVRLVGGGTMEGPSHGTILVHITPNCSLIVKEVTFDQKSMPPARPSPKAKGVRVVEPIVHDLSPNNSPSENVATSNVSHFLGWAESEYNDVVGIDLTRVHAEMKYFDNGTQVYGGHDPYNECYAFWDGWRILSCAAHWWPNGPNYVYTNTEGEFEWLFGQYRHWHKAQYDGWPNGVHQWWCDHRGNTVPGGYWKCEGGRQTL